MTTNHTHLLDTNVLSDLVRRPAGPGAAAIRRVGEHAICTSVIVEAELRFGARKSGSDALSERVDVLLSAIEILPFDSSAAREYGSLRQELESAGKPIGPNDMLIAAQARAADLVVVTANTREFGRVRDLRVENWLA